MWTILHEIFVIFYIGKYIGKAEFWKYPTIFADAPFRETLSDFHSIKSDFWPKTAKNESPNFTNRPYFLELCSTWEANFWYVAWPWGDLKK